MFTRKEFRRFFRERLQDRGIKLIKSKRLGLSIDELVKHSAKRNKNMSSPHLDLWIEILDELLSWLLSLLTVVYVEIRGGKDKASDFERSVWMILMKLIADSLALRHLILVGYDVQARVLLRSTFEYFELLVALLDDPQLATQFVAADTPEMANEFWKKHLSKGKIRKRIKNAWLRFFQNSDTEMAIEMANWGFQTYGQLSALTHPSFAGGLFSAIPLKSKHTDENWLGIWGDKSDASVDTIDIYASYIFPVLLLSRGFPFEGYESHVRYRITFDDTNEFHKHVKYGRDVLAGVIMSLWKETNRALVFPETDYSIFK